MDWIDVDEYRYWWRDLVNTEKWTFGFQKVFRKSLVVA